MNLLHLQSQHIHQETPHGETSTSQELGLMDVTWFRTVAFSPFRDGEWMGNLQLTAYGNSPCQVTVQNRWSHLTVLLYCCKLLSND